MIVHFIIVERDNPVMIDEMMIAIIMLIIGIILLLAEAAAPGNFIIVPATMLTILGIVFIFIPDQLLTIYTPILAVIILIVAAVLAIQLYKRMSPVAPPETLVGTSLVGRVGVVTTMITPSTMLGKVRVNGEVWSAEASSNIPAGTPVKIIASEGVHVTVEEISQEEYNKYSSQEAKAPAPKIEEAKPAKSKKGEGETAIVITLISPGLGTGKVKIGDEVFNATADCNIYAGTEVRVISKDANGVRVEEI